MRSHAPCARPGTIRGFVGAARTWACTASAIHGFAMRQPPRSLLVFVVLLCLSGAADSISAVSHSDKGNSLAMEGKFEEADVEVGTDPHTTIIPSASRLTLSRRPILYRSSKWRYHWSPKIMTC
jgi:hypothetical protein